SWGARSAWRTSGGTAAATSARPTCCAPPAGCLRSSLWWGTWSRGARPSRWPRLSLDATAGRRAPGRLASRTAGRGVVGFGGGKGGATGLGAFLVLVPWAALPALLVFVVVTATFRYVSLATIMASACVPLGALLLGYPRASVLACVAAAAVVIGRHHENIAR